MRPLLRAAVGLFLVRASVRALLGPDPHVAALAGIAILALWPRREVRAVDPEDARALRTFLLRGPGEFPHRSHLRVARLYLSQLPLGEAIERFGADLRRFAHAKGADTKYHQTITVAFLLLMRARLAGAPAGEGFDAFLARNPDLASSGCLKAFYSEAALASELARRDFLFPDRLASAP